MDLKTRERTPYVDRQTQQILQSRKLKRRRRRRLRKTVTFLVVLVVIALVTLSLTVFFKVGSVNVIGCTKYTPEEIAEASGIRLGENMLLLKGGNAAQKVEEAFVYVEAATVKKDIFSGTVTIEISQAEPFCVLESSDGNGYLISRNGTVLEKASIQTQQYQLASGVDMAQAAVGSELDSDGNEQLRVLELVCQALDESGLESVTRIDLQDVLNITLEYDHRILIECGTETELAYKLKYAKTILEKDIGPNEQGTLDVASCHTASKASFSPRREEVSDGQAESSEENS